MHSRLILRSLLVSFLHAKETDRSGHDEDAVAYNVDGQQNHDVLVVILLFALEGPLQLRCGELILWINAIVHLPELVFDEIDVGICLRQRFNKKEQVEE